MAAMDFRGAVLRGWRLLVLLALVGAVVGYFSVPSKPAVSNLGKSGLYKSTVIVSPSIGRNSISLSRLFLDLKNPDVVAETARIAHVGVTASQIAGVISVENGRAALDLTKKEFRGLKIKALGISVVWYSPTTSAILANAAASAVAVYIRQQANLDYISATKQAAQNIAALNAKISSINSQIAGASSTSGTLSVLGTQRRVLSGQLQDQTRKQIQLELSGAKIPGYDILRAAVSHPAPTHKTTLASVANHRSTRILGGLAVGLLIALAIILLVEVLDRSLRTVRSAEEAFDLPVVAEIPARGSVRGSLQRTVVDARLQVVVDPGSAAAEAYRRLHTAVLLEPLAAELALYGNGNGNGYGNGYGNGNGNGYGNGYGNGNGNGFGNGHGNSMAENGGARGQTMAPAYPADPANGGDLVHEGNGNDRRARRQVVLVVSPGAEKTRPTVVANLAAVYAEAGARALVVTLGDLRWGRGPGPTPTFEGDEIDPQDLVPLSQPSSVDGVSRLRFDQILGNRGQVVTQGPAIITAARQVADAVLIDAPSLLSTHDAIALLPAVDVVLVVAQYAVTRSDEGRESGDILRRFRAPVLGVVFTNVPSRERSPRGKGRESEGSGDMVLESYTISEREPASSSGLWL
jgi:hypothetical protein